MREFIGRAQGGNIYLEAVKDGDVDLHQSLIFPEGGGLSGVQAHLVCNLLSSKQENIAYNYTLVSVCIPLYSERAGRYLQHVVAGRVAEVPHADLRTHVPATEGTGSELQTSDLQQHV